MSMFIKIDTEVMPYLLILTYFIILEKRRRSKRKRSTSLMLYCMASMR